MYQYTDFDRQFVRQRAAQYRDQLQRNLAGTLADDEFADYAAGRLILDEAGGQAEALDGGAPMSGPALKRGIIAAASPSLFAEWSAWVKGRS